MRDLDFSSSEPIYKISVPIVRPEEWNPHQEKIQNVLDEFLTFKYNLKL